MKMDLTTEPLGDGKDGKPVFLRDIWPTNEEIATIQRKAVTNEMFAKRYADVFKGDKHWQAHQGRRRPDLRLGHRLDLCAEPALLRGHDDDARRRSPTSSRPASWPSSATRITTDHISPAGSIKATSPAGRYLLRAPGRPERTSTPTARAAATTR